MAEFTPWPKTPRLFRTIVVTEKIDGTNAAIHIESDGTVTAQSRNRIITPDSDNYGFAAWVNANAAELAATLGAGLHFGEWWGSGIQRRYGFTNGERFFSLFNTDKWRDLRTCVGGVELRSVPVLYQGEFSEAEIKSWLRNLAQHGSVAAPGFDNPEGICVWHSQTRTVFKVTLDNNDRGKWEEAQA